MWVCLPIVRSHRKWAWWDSASLCNRWMGCGCHGTSDSKWLVTGRSIPHNHWGEIWSSGYISQQMSCILFPHLISTQWLKCWLQSGSSQSKCFWPSWLPRRILNKNPASKQWQQAHYKMIARSKPLSLFGLSITRSISHQGTQDWYIDHIHSLHSSVSGLDCCIWAESELDRRSGSF